MKKIISAALFSAVLMGCSVSHDSSTWQANNAASIATQTVKLESNLWIDLMPQIGQSMPLTKEQNLHGALNLTSPQQLPAEMDVSQVVLKQADNTWELDSKDFDLRNHSETHWEIAFKWQVNVNSTAPVDVAVQLVSGSDKVWVANKQVTIDTVY
ncbi:hypothetical protein [Vibrio hippocampi]|uniref:DNA polymerase III subunit beta n=1 Tax=Vibrio hippocampi TaxID=654686 RepID=A0ABM8ZJW7_9VIBR|nr:hypothetical protein [Vibrio hippocampi]CAH0527055.1 hypothetical protein VHP8226_02396 [Vibrio hippocampi]